MSWEESYHARRPCPCGKGEVEEVGRQNDWMQSETTREMLCLDCRERYVYSGEVIGGHPGNEIERGLILRTVLDAERSYKEDVMAVVRENCLPTWRKRFEGTHTKKGAWEIYTVNGRFSPSLGTFYKNTKLYPDHKQLLRYLERDFQDFHNLHRILSVTGIRPVWSDHGVVAGQQCELCQGSMKAISSLGSHVWVCLNCGYRRPVL